MLWIFKNTSNKIGLRANEGWDSCSYSLPVKYNYIRHVHTFWKRQLSASKVSQAEKQWDKTQRKSIYRHRSSCRRLEAFIKSPKWTKYPSCVLETMLTLIRPTALKGNVYSPDLNWETKVGGLFISSPQVWCGWKSSTLDMHWYEVFLSGIIKTYYARLS